MATFTSAATGNWNDGAAWGNASPGDEGTHFPGTNDYAVLTGGFTATVPAGSSCNVAYVYINGSTLAFGAGGTLTFKDAVGGLAGGVHLRATTASGSGFNSNGTVAAPAVIASASTTPTYPIKFQIDDDVPEDRTLDFTNMEFRGTAVYLGNNDDYLYFNDGTTTSGYATGVSPLVRTPALRSHLIDGRSHGRISYGGCHAGTVTFTAVMRWDSWRWGTLQEMATTDAPISFISQYSALPRCRIESYRPGRIAHPWLTANITLTEDD